MDKKELKKIARRKLYEIDPKKETLRELVELYDEVERVEKLQPLKGEKGDNGVGEREERGEKGEDGLPGINGIDGKDGKDGINGISGKNGRDGLDGVDGRNGSPDTAEQIVDKLNTLEEVLEYKVLKGVPTIKEIVEEMKKLPLDERLDISDIKNWNQPAKGRLDQRWHGAGGGSLSTNGIPIQEIPMGAIDGINNVFTLSQIPKANTLLLVRGGVTMFTLTRDYIISNKTISLTLAPPMGVTLVASYSY